MDKQKVLIIISGKKLTFSIAGVVTDGVNNVADVTVAIGTYSTTTAANGSYTISGLPGGISGSLTATKTGYLFSSISISAMASNLTGQNFVSPWFLYGGIPLSNCIGAYKAKGADNLAASYVNLAGNAAYDCTPGEAPTFDASYGWSFNGSSNYLITNIVPVLTNQNWSMMVRFTDGGTSKVICGVDNAGANKFALYTTVYYQHVNTLFKTAFTAGILSICGVNAFRNKTSDGSITAGSSTNTQKIYIGAASRSGAPSAYGNSKVQALAVWNIDISAYQSAVHDAMAAL